MSFTFELDLLTAFEIGGLALAAIGFFNLSEHLERAFTAMQNGVWNFARWRIAKRDELWPPHKHWRTIALEALVGWLIAAPLSALIIEWLDLWEPFFAILERTPDWQVWLGFAAAFILLIPFELISVFGLSTLTVGIFYMIARLFWLLGLPPSGVTGSVGLLVTIITFVLGRTEMGAGLF